MWSCSGRGAMKIRIGRTGKSARKWDEFHGQLGEGGGGCFGCLLMYTTVQLVSRYGPCRLPILVGSCNTSWYHVNSSCSCSCFSQYNVIRNQINRPVLAQHPSSVCYDPKSGESSTRGRFDSVKNIFCGAWLKARPRPIKNVKRPAHITSWILHTSTEYRSLRAEGPVTRRAHGSWWIGTYPRPTEHRRRGQPAGRRHKAESWCCWCGRYSQKRPVLPLRGAYLYCSETTSYCPQARTIAAHAAGQRDLASC